MRMQEHSNKLETNVEAESQDFGIGDASVVIEILRNRLYERKIPTLTQEYICNARDAMREVGKGNEFEITVPTRLNPVFKVRDFGPGISPDRMRSVFVMYGSSTKRGTNGQTGGFGIGAKSAWSYTDSFTIVSIVDGKRRTYVAHTGVNNNGRLDLVDTCDTEEPNGTEIQIAVKQHDLDEFRASIFRAIYFWDVKPTLKGELSPPTLVKGEVISDLLEIIDNGILPGYVRPNEHDMLAIIDGVTYKINHDLISKCPSLQGLSNIVMKQVVLHFGNGVVEVAASREKIADSKGTIAALEKLGKRALVEAQTHITDAFGKVKSTPEYLQTYARVSKYLDADSFAKYGDYSINKNRVSNPIFSKVRMTLVHCMGKYGRGRVDKITKVEFHLNRSEIEVEHLGSLFYVINKENKLVENKRIREHFKTHTHMIMIEQLNTTAPTLDAKGQPMLDSDKKQIFHPVSYPNEFKQVIAELGAREFTTTLTYVDPPRVVKPRVKQEDAAICMHGTRYGTRHNYTTLAKNTKKWIYVTLNEGIWPNKCTREQATDLSEYTEAVEGFQVCGLAAKAAKTVKNDPNYVSLEDWLKAFSPTKETLLAAKSTLSKQLSSVNALHGLVKDINDPLLVEMCQEYATFSKAKVSRIPAVIANKVAEIKEVKEFKEADEEFGKLMKDEYPLVGELDHYSRNKKELVFYINAKYKARKGK